MAILELETMHVEINGALGRLRFNRPEALNAANQTWVQDLLKATDYLAQHEQARVIIVSGEGRAFCSGLDVKELAEGRLTRPWFENWEHGVIRLIHLSAITIAAIQGYCLGGGLQIALACDLRIAATDAVLSIPAVREGVIAALGPMRLARLIGESQAKQLCLLGRRFSAQEGLTLGLLTEVTTPERLNEHALALAEELLALPFIALLHTKRQIDHAFTQDNETLLAEMLARQEECLRSPEHAAVMESYREQQRQRAERKHKEASDEEGIHP